jgi:hypothetical protein
MLCPFALDHLYDDDDNDDAHQPWNFGPWATVGRASARAAYMWAGPCQRSLVVSLQTRGESAQAGTRGYMGICRMGMDMDVQLRYAQRTTEVLAGTHDVDVVGKAAKSSHHLLTTTGRARPEVRRDVGRLHVG